MKKILLISTIILLTACSTKVFHAPTTLSTSVKAIPEYKELGEVNVKKCNVFVLFFAIPANYEKMYKDAMQDAQDMGGDGLIDFQMKSAGFTIVYPFFMRDCWSASGTAVKFQAKGSSWDAATTNSSEEPKKSKWDSVSPTETTTEPTEESNFKPLAE